MAASPLITRKKAELVEATAIISGCNCGSARTRASPEVSELLSVIFSILGEMTSVLMPCPSISLVTPTAAPRPIPIVVKTEATPIIKPNIVKSERILFAAMLSQATLA